MTLLREDLRELGNVALVWLGEDSRLLVAASAAVSVHIGSTACSWSCIATAVRSGDLAAIRERPSEVEPHQELARRVSRWGGASCACTPSVMWSRP